ncbi:5'-methylthioadenosine/adenosylhomocysteine nucleosidase [Ruminococcus sp.]|uniref:5'-methylthioadenosine/adenosylhomocysteine nucleosidase n=1 Tax=Ruminococcus sp. TaxID=41978 RepID=UPI00386CD0BB
MVGIICAMQIEADGILALMENKKQREIAKMTFTSGTLNGKELVVVVCGVGKVNAAMCSFALIQNYAPDCVINSGVAGSVSEKVSVGDIVVATNAVEHDMNTTALGDKQGEVSFPEGTVMYFDCDKHICETLYNSAKKLENTKVEKGTVASGDIFISKRSQRVNIGKTFNALACEMEGAAIAHICSRAGVPCGILRAISDDLNENEGMDFVKFCEMASKKTVAVVNDFVNNI